MLFNGNRSEQRWSLLLSSNVSEGGVSMTAQMNGTMSIVCVRLPFVS